jgi:hypothetical protein
VLHLRLIILSVEGDVPVDSEPLLVTDFMNLNIKSVQYFKCAHKGMMCVCVYMGEYSYIYKYMCLYYVLKKWRKYIPNDKKATRHIVRNWGTPDCTPK